MVDRGAFYLNMHTLLIVTTASEYDLDLCGDFFKGHVMSKMWEPQEWNIRACLFMHINAYVIGKMIINIDCVANGVGRRWEKIAFSVFAHILLNVQVT